MLRARDHLSLSLLSMPTLQLLIYHVNVNTFKQNKIFTNSTNVLGHGKYRRKFLFLSTIPFLNPS